MIFDSNVWNFHEKVTFLYIRKHMRNDYFSLFPILHLWKITVRRKTVMMITVMTVTTRGRKTTHLIHPWRRRKLGMFSQSLVLFLFWNPLCPLGKGMLSLSSLQVPPKSSVHKSAFLGSSCSIWFSFYS